MPRLAIGNLAKIKLGCLTAKQRRSEHITMAECVKQGDKWVYAGGPTKKAPRSRVNIDDVFLVLNIFPFEEDGYYAVEAAVLLLGDKTVICAAENVKRANKKELLTTAQPGIIKIDLIT